MNAKIAFFLLIASFAFANEQDHFLKNVFAPPNSVTLIQVAEEIPQEKICSKEVQEIIENMLVLANVNRVDLSRPIMVGLAAPQIGISKKIILADTTSDGEDQKTENIKIYINPKIISHSEEIILDREGCYSTSNITGIVPRYKAVTLTAYDKMGNSVTETHCGLAARILQHEIDHTLGICFPERAGEDAELHIVEPEEYPEYRKNWKNWPRKCSREHWNTIKNGKSS